MLLVKTVQRYTINPLMRLLLAVGINPLGVAILETWGHASGKTRRVPVGNGRKGDSFWIIAEHGSRAGYVRNIQHDPHVRVRLRIGLRYRWVPGIATVCPDDDPLARQRQIIAWHAARSSTTRYTSACSVPTCSPCTSNLTLPQAEVSAWPVPDRGCPPRCVAGIDDRSDTGFLDSTPRPRGSESQRARPTIVRGRREHASMGR